MKSRAAVASLATSLVLTGAWSQRAFASPLFELSGDVAGEGGLTARTSGASAASTYFNPARLPDADSGLTLGVFVLTVQVSIGLNARRPSGDVPIGLENAEHADGTRFNNYPIPTTYLANGRPANPPDPALAARPRQAKGTGRQTHAYQSIGLVTKFFQNRLALGIYALVPYSKFTGAQAFYSDEREQYFTNSLHPELYSDRLTATSLAFGGGFKITDALSAGLGFTLSLKTTAVTPTYVVDAGKFNSILVDSKVDVNASVAPHFGLAYKVLESLRLSATAHTPQKLEIKTNFTFLLANGIEQAAGVSFTHAYMPWTFALGGAWDAIKKTNFSLSAVAVAKYARWSDYLDRHSEKPRGAYAWSDTITPAAGVRVHAGTTTGLLDVEFQPSPVPPQTGRTNYVDNDRLGTSFGVDHAFPLLGTTLHVGLQGQVHYLLKRRTGKIAGGDNPLLLQDEVPDDAVIGGTPVNGRAGLQTNNPGWPGYSVQGYLLGGGLYLRINS